METILVGVDGSQGARRALRYAAAEAVLRGARLRIICAWRLPSQIYLDGALPEETLEGFRFNAEQIVRDALREVELANPGLECEAAALEGQPADVLIREAEKASLVVVGNRGHGGFSSLLLGSVGQQVVHHAHCPVLVVPHDLELTPTARDPGLPASR